MFEETRTQSRCCYTAISALLMLLHPAGQLPRCPQETWRGLTVAPESRCSHYNPGDYPYAQSVEDRLVAQLGGVYSPYTGEWFADKYRDRHRAHRGPLGGPRQRPVRCRCSYAEAASLPTCAT